MPTTLITPGYLFNTDPVCHVIDGRLWVFCAQDQYSVQFQVPEDIWNNIGSVHAYSTSDLREWIDHGTAFSSRDAGWCSGHSLWPGDCGVEAGGKFYAYPSFRNGSFQIAAMVAENPSGPYRDALGKALIDDEALAAHGVDIEALKRYKHLNAICVWDEHGAPWLIFGHLQLFRVRLKPTMVELDGPMIPMDVPCRGGEAQEYVENPRINRMGGKYVFSYVAYKNLGGVPNPYYKEDDPEGPYIQYCVSDQIWGPYTDPRHLIYPARPDACNITNSLVEFGGRTLAVYHVPFDGKEHRHTGFAELRFGNDGLPIPLRPATDEPLVAQNEVRLRLDAFGPRRYAVEYHHCHGAESERGVKQFHHMKMSGGGWLRFDRVDFGAGASAVELSAGSERMRLLRGELEFRVDAPDGPLVATVPVGKSAQHDQYKLVRCPCAPVAGVHDLYLVARGCDSPVSSSSPLFKKVRPELLPQSGGPLFNVDWFRWIPLAGGSAAG